MRDFTRRDFLKMAGIGTIGATAALALAACGTKNETEAPSAGTSAPSAGSSTPSTGAVSGSTGAEMQAGEAVGTVTAEEGTEFIIAPEVTVGESILFPTLVPFRNTSYQRGTIIRMLYDRLAYLNAQGKYVPQGAKNWTVAEDGVTWTVELYDTITDSEGRSITANDIVWFVTQSQEQNTKPCFKKIKSIEAKGDYTVEMVFAQNIAEAFEVCLESTFLVSQESYEASADGFATKPISASPYVVTEFKPDNSITFELRDDYWQTEEQDPGLGHNIQKLTHILITEASQQQIALETGTIDIMPGINPTVVSSFLNNDNYLVSMAPANNGNQLRFTGYQERLVGRDENLRKAICYAIDVDMLIAGAANGYGEPMDDYTPRTSGGWFESFKDMDYFHYDEALAKDYLSKSDYKGEELILAGTTSYQKAYQIIQANCQAIGINVKLDIKDQSLFTTESNDGRLWDMAMINTGNGAANMWTQSFDGTVYEYGDSMAHQDEELNEMVHFTWQNANYTEENITKVRNYLFDHAYVYGLFLSYALSVTNSSLGIAETVFQTQGRIDPAACKFAAI